MHTPTRLLFACMSFKEYNIIEACMHTVFSVESVYTYMYSLPTLQQNVDAHSYMPTVYLRDF